MYYKMVQTFLATCLGLIHCMYFLGRQMLLGIYKQLEQVHTDVYSSIRSCELSKPSPVG